MVSIWWVVVALFAGAAFGIFIMALLNASGGDDK